jgi:MFS family permease
MVRGRGTRGRGYRAVMSRTAPSGLPTYLATATLARSASESAGPALLIVAVAVLGTASTGSFLVAAMTASGAVSGPVIGALLDRSPQPRRAFAIALACLGLGLAGVAIWIGHAPFAVVLGFAVAAGLGYPAATGAWSAQIPRVIAPSHLHRAYGADAATYSVAAVVAPPVAAATVALTTRAPLWLSVALVAATLVALRALPLAPAAHDRPPTSLFADLRAGTALMARNVALRRTVIITTLGFAGQSAVFVCAPVLAQSVGGSLQFTGVVLGVFAAGGVVTAIWFTGHPVKRPDRMVIVSTLLSAVALTFVGLAPTPWLLLIAAFAMGAVEPPLMSSMFQIRARESPAHVQSQVFTTSASLRMGAFAAGTAICGVLVSHSVAAVIAFGVGLHLVALIIGVVVGPDLPNREEWLHRDSRTVGE